MGIEVRARKPLTVVTATTASIEDVSARRRLLHHLPPRKLFWDPVHGEISLHPVSVAILDTPEFQRLRHISQLGTANYVYPGASHTRFEHSLGTAHLARLLGSRIRERQPELNITDKELLCLELAGLCHDLGHGPFSHVWESFYRSGATSRGLAPLWSHETMSCKLLRHLLRVHGLQEIFDAWEQHFGQGFTSEDLKLVQDLILGNVDQTSPSRRFLFQIVCNPDSGLDVDKWDYYLRDSHAVGVTCGFQYERLVSSARVVFTEDGEAHIAFRDKELENVYEMFRTRSRLHKTVYRHRFTGVAETMICDAIRLVDEKTRNIFSHENRFLRFWQTTHDVARPDAVRAAIEEFVALTDRSVELSVRSSRSSDPDVLRAQRLWRSLLKNSICVTEEAVRASFLDALPEDVRPPTEDLVLNLENVHWGRGTEDPVRNVLFYRKSRPDAPVRIDELRTLGRVYMVPSKFQDSLWHFILRAPPKPGFEQYLDQCLASLRTTK
ncbi:deoxynucleoside triphosphate triphosphohydrolase SAMHD1 [Rhipicephalus sanguineus]|uniref:deoxynucleoside triphosphate triphosphohydrolase SAMHD1 n=1 Tax=Rhipicephalus sanguineus TaxID=34632 RepID=UPI0018956C3A|nr:deoxynucleoside triphosphate triphosphohydrolase SAMHD1 [Rhipicephalus sanguineus]